ncbi:MAG: hypothetical protein V4520_00710 [Bacteroidota bacterium]
MIQSNQKSSQQKGFFAAPGLRRKALRTTGRKSFASPAHTSPLQKFPMPLPRTGPPSFFPLSDEAILLTGEINY